MTTSFQEEVCVRCAHHRFYTSPIGTEFDRITCARGKVERNGGCEYFKL